MGDPGDVLVFLPGMAEIERVARLLEGIDAEIHLLHGSLSTEAQDRALLPSARRKVVLSTDIAETSLTVEGVRIVVDSGSGPGPPVRSRTPGMTRLRTVPISKSSAEQRAGRAGRTQSRDRLSAVVADRARDPPSPHGARDNSGRSRRLCAGVGGLGKARPLPPCRSSINPPRGHTGKGWTCLAAWARSSRGVP